MHTEFLGHSVQYWAELQRRFELETGPTAAGLLEEVVTLQGKVGFYETRIRQMAEIMGRGS